MFLGHVPFKIISSSPLAGSEENSAKRPTRRENGQLDIIRQLFRRVCRSGIRRIMPLPTLGSLVGNPNAALMMGFEFVFTLKKKVAGIWHKRIMGKWIDLIWEKTFQKWWKYSVSDLCSLMNGSGLHMQRMHGFEFSFCLSESMPSTQSQ